MIKRMLSLWVAFCLLAAMCLTIPACAAAEDAGPMTAAELTALAESALETALNSEPLNNPADESAKNEDGTLFQYTNFCIYADGTELTAGSAVNALLYQDSEGFVIRDTGIDTQVTDLLAAYALDNTELAGTKGEAVLYLRPTENSGFLYGRVLRDGQRILAAEYGEVVNSGERYRKLSVTYTLTTGLVSSIRADGLNPETGGQITAAEAEEMYAALLALTGKDEYKAVKTSRNGLELTPFGEEDLVFSGIAFTTVTPETLPGSPEHEMIDNEDGTWLLRCDGDGYEAVFRCDAEGRNTKIMSLTILDEEMEGPRCVRLGDQFSEDFCRFRNGENEMGEDMTELLYGTDGTAPYGIAAYEAGAGETSLRYAAALEDGTVVELLLKYEENRLAEIIIYTE